ncbi:MAG: energy transducer TonB [Gammaproteobacteria bacterium]
MALVATSHLRLPIALGGAALVAIALFWGLNAVIYGRGISVDDADVLQTVDFVRLKRESELQVRERRKPPPPPPPKQPPPPPDLVVQNPNQPRQAPLSIETPNIQLGVGGNGPYIGSWSAGDPSADGEVIPIVKINPQWPREALLEGIEGYVEVEFTIQPDGSVADVNVIDAAPRRLFVRNAIRAILKWKFKPRIVDGQPVARRATQRIEFKIEGTQ